MKQLLLATTLILSLFFNGIFGQGVEDFTNLPTASSGSYLARTWTGTDGVTWTAEGARTDQTITGKAICFGNSGNRWVTSPSYSNGMGTLTFDYVRGFTGTSARAIQVWVNGTQIGADITVSNTSNTVVNYSNAINISGNVVLEIRSIGAAQVKIDNISWTTFGGCTPPTLQATSFGSSGVSYNNGTVSWVRGNGNNVIVVAQAGSAAGTPTSGVTYSANAAYGSGAAIGSGFVVYNGTGTSVPVTGLTSGITYHFAVYEYATTGTCYLTPGLTGNFTTLSISNSSDIISAGGESATIPSTNIAAGPLTSATGQQVWQFTVRDGGASNDADNLPTILTDFTITQNAGNAMNDWDVAIQSVDIFDGTTHLATGVVTSNQISFSGLTITAPDNGSKTISMRMSLNCPASNSNNLDGDDFVFQISQGNVTEAGSGSSQFASFSATNSVNGLNEFDQIQTNITSITPSSGPTGSVVTINASGGGFTGATAVSFNGTAASSFTIISDTEIEAVVAAGTTTGDVNVTDAFCYTDAFTAFSVISTDNSGCEGAAIFTDLIISEMTDASVGSYTYIEVYNGTGASVDLSTYDLIQKTNGGGETTINLAGTLLDGNTYVVRVGGTGGACAAGALPNGYATEDQTETGVSGINNNDCFRLENSSVTVDVWGVCDGSVWVVNSDNGYNYRRVSTVTSPNTTYTPAEWTITDWTAGDCSDDDYITIGSHDAGGSSSPTVTSSPTTTALCPSSSTTLTVSGTEGFVGGLGLAYQWYVSAPGAGTWTALTNTGVYTGVTTATLNISNLTGLDDYQYYCQIRENTATCYTASNSIQLDVLGVGGTPGLWTGASSTDWCDCANWDDAVVPTNTTNVVINQTALNNCVVNTACAGVALSTALSSNNATNNLLTVSGSGTLAVTNGLTVTKSAGAGALIVETTGTGSISAGSVTLTGSGAGIFDAILRNESATTTIDINGNFTIASGGFADFNANGTMNLSGDFLNNHSALGFDEGNSTIIFDGGVNQNINVAGFTETFHNITLAKSGGTLILQDPITLDATGVLALSDDQLELNGNEMTINNPATTAITRTSGSIVEESGAAAGNNAGKISWNMGSTTGAHIYPFASAVAGTYIPFTFDLTAGNAGIVSLSTYNTAADNTPWPVSPQSVTNLASTTGLLPDNRDATADRFWQIDKSGASGTANLTFSYLTSELPVAPFNDHTKMIAQRYNDGVDKWEMIIHPGQTRSAIAGGFTVTVPNISTFSPWTLASLDSPLPAELIEFNAKANGDQVDLTWTTASEINVSHFVVERSKNGIDFAAVLTQEAAGNSTSIINYIDKDLHPFQGESFYRLLTVDFDGSSEYSATRKVNFSGSSVSVNYGYGEWILNYEVATEDCSITIINSIGEIISIHNNADFSDNSLNINHDNLAKGVYFIQITDGSNIQSIKVIK